MPRIVKARIKPIFEKIPAPVESMAKGTLIELKAATNNGVFALGSVSEPI